MTMVVPASDEGRDSSSESLRVTPGMESGEGGSTSQDGNLLGDAWLTSADPEASLMTTSGTMSETRGAMGAASCRGECLE